MRHLITRTLIALCGKEPVNNKQPESEVQFNRANLFSLLTALATIILLSFTLWQVRDVKETNSADFALKLKGDILSADNVKLISLLDDTLIKFHQFGDKDGWFELDTAGKRPGLVIEHPSDHYTLVQIDLMLQAFENLSFYERQKRIDMGYVYEQYAYYITAIWRNPDIQQYIIMTRKQLPLRYSYRHFERLYNYTAKRLSEDSVKAISDSIAAARCKKR